MGAASAMKNLHVPLPEELYRELRGEAQRSGRPATEIARSAIECWLQERRKAEIYEAVAAYAAQWAGTSADLDPDLEAAAVECLLATDRRRT